MKRNILSVFVGYVVFVIIAVLYFNLTGINPELMPELKDIIITGIVSGFGSLLCGYITASISKDKTKIALGSLSGLIGIVSLISIFAQPETSHWTQIMTLFWLAPLAYVGGLIKLRQKKPAANNVYKQ